MPTLLQRLNDGLGDVAESVWPSLVKLNAGSGRGGGAGAGTIWHADGLVITNAPVWRLHEHNSRVERVTALSTSVLGQVAKYESRGQDWFSGVMVAPISLAVAAFLVLLASAACDKRNTAEQQSAQPVPDMTISQVLEQHSGALMSLPGVVGAAEGNALRNRRLRGRGPRGWRNQRAPR